MEAPTTSILILSVNELLAEGWKIFGPLQFCGVFMQPMILKTEAEPEPQPLPPPAKVSVSIDVEQVRLFIMHPGEQVRFTPTFGKEITLTYAV